MHGPIFPFEKSWRNCNSSLAKNLNGERGAKEIDKLLSVGWHKLSSQDTMIYD